MKIVSVKKGSLFLAFLFFVTYSFSQSYSCVKHILFPIEVNGKWGFIDSNGIIRIDPVFEMVSEFSEGLAVFKETKNNLPKYGFVDWQGKIVVNANYPVLRPLSGGYAAFGDKKFGFIDFVGDTLIKPVYDSVTDFFENRAFVQSNGLWGIIDDYGKLIIEPKYFTVTSFHNGLAIIGLKVKKDLSNEVVMKSVINKQGMTLIPFTDSEIYINPENFIICQDKNNHRTYFNSSGNLIFK